MANGSLRNKGAPAWPPGKSTPGGHKLKTDDPFAFSLSVALFPHKRDEVVNTVSKFHDFAVTFHIQLDRRQRVNSSR